MQPFILLLAWLLLNQVFMLMIWRVCPLLSPNKFSNNLKTILLLLLPTLSFSQITHLKTVICRVKEFGERELICVTFYRGSKIGYDLATHEGNFIGKCEILNVRSSDCSIDSTVVPKLIRAFNEREARRKNTEQGQAIVIGTSLLIIKAMLDDKLDWK